MARQTSFHYDNRRNLTCVEDPDDGLTYYTYDRVNRMTSVLNPWGEVVRDKRIGSLRSTIHDLMLIEELTLTFPRLPPQFAGMTAAVVTDLHAGRGHGTHAFVEHLVTQVNHLHADAILLLGDLVHHTDCTGHFFPLLAELCAPEGVWACLGNHEHEFVWYSPWFRNHPQYSVEDWRRWYESAGAHLLVNEAHPLTRDGARLWLVGVDDTYTGRQDLSAALAQTEPGEFRLVLSHSPDLLDDPRIAETDLVLSGHTHGGQVWIPGVGPFMAPCRRPAQRAAGLIRHHSGATMYVSRGAGEGMRLRIGCPREVTLLTLQRGPTAPAPAP